MQPYLTPRDNDIKYLRVPPQNISAAGALQTLSRIITIALATFVEAGLDIVVSCREGFFTEVPPTMTASNASLISVVDLTGIQLPQFAGEVGWRDAVLTIVQEGFDVIRWASQCENVRVIPQ